MTEYVYKPVRFRAGKRVVSRVFSGRFSLGRGQKVFTVPLDTSDRKVAEKRLRDLVADRQREAEGIVSPRVIRDAAALPLGELLADYASDLRSRSTSPHATESIARIRRVLAETDWKRLADVTPASWVKWRASLAGSARTVRAYQTSVVAWANWLVRMDRLTVNPLARVGAVRVKGKSVRESRAFTLAELSALCASAPAYRSVVYLFLAYTGARKDETRSALWGDLDLGERPLFRVRAESAKSGTKRVVPLKPQLAERLCEWRRASDVVNASLPESRKGEAAFVFPRFPSDDAFHGDLRRAGVCKKDDAGRVVHFHALRKTFQTWGAVAGVGQRSAQEMLGHSDPSLTSGVYTDIASLELHDEVAKLPWLSSDTQNDTQKETKTATPSRFRQLLAELMSIAQDVVAPGETAVSGAPSLAARHGFEP